MGLEAPGSIAPTEVRTSASADWTATCSRTYTLPHIFRVHVEGMDEWQARTFRELDIVVRNDSSKPLFINCRAARGGALLRRGTGSPRRVKVVPNNMFLAFL